MTRDEAIRMIRMALGFRTDLETVCVDALKLAQTNLELGPVKPWFLRSELSHVNTVIGESRVVLPTDMLIEADDAALEFYNSDDELTEIVKGQLDWLTLQFATEDPGPPEAYALDGRYLRLFPTPDAIYTIYNTFYAQDTVLDTNVENQWLKYVPMLLIGEAGLLVAAGVRDKDAQAEFNRMRSEGSLLLVSQNESREHANMEYQIGGPH